MNLEGVIINHSCVQGWTDTLGGTANTGDDPLFLDLDGVQGNFRLQAGSPAIDTGDNTGFSLSDLDLDGLPRIIDHPYTDVPLEDPLGVIDMGPYEAQPLGIAEELKPPSDIEDLVDVAETARPIVEQVISEKLAGEPLEELFEPVESDKRNPAAVALSFSTHFFVASKRN